MRPLFQVNRPIEQSSEGNTGVWLLLLVGILFVLFVLPSMSNRKNLLVLCSDMFNNAKETFSSAIPNLAFVKSVYRESKDEAMLPYDSYAYGV